MRRSTLCYISDADRILMLYRNKKENDPNEGKWIGIGGKIEAGETPEECIRREVMEETGLILTDLYFHGIIKFISESWGDEDMYLFSSSGYEGEMNDLCDEGELRWIERDKLLSLPLWEGDKHFLKALLSGRDRIEMTLIYRGTGSEEHLSEVIDNS